MSRSARSRAAATVPSLGGVAGTDASNSSGRSPSSSRCRSRGGHSALDDVFELPDVAGKAVTREQPPGLRVSNRSSRCLARIAPENARPAARRRRADRAAAAGARGAGSAGSRDPRGSPPHRPRLADRRSSRPRNGRRRVRLSFSPIRRTSPDSSARSSFACSGLDIVPISSRNSVPPVACSIRPDARRRRR